MASFMRYPGGKSKLRKPILESLGKFYKPGMEYREPFFGGGSIGLEFFASTKAKKLWFNDKDPGIVCLWKSVFSHKEEFKKKIVEFVPSIQAFKDFKSELLGLNDIPSDPYQIVDIGFKKLAIHQISYSGLGTKSGGPLGGEAQESKYKVDCRWSPSYICKKIDKINGEFSSCELRGDGCTNLDYLALIEDSSCDSILFCDPPYYEKGEDLYQCAFKEEDHIQLAEALKKSVHPWVLTYDSHEFIENLYSWASVERLDVNYSITALKEEDGTRKSRTKGELLITR